MGNDELSDDRADTDASLEAERASADTAAARALRSQQRRRDALIERDRMLADQQLLRVRDRADDRLARERADGPPPTSAVVRERDRADARRVAERLAIDAVAEHHQEVTIAALESVRREEAQDRARQDVRRDATNRRLSAERSDTDTTLVDAHAALVRAHGERTYGADMLAMVAHDLRSPLCVIALNAQGVVDEAADASTREMASDMVLAAGRMERLINDLFDDARVQSGMMQMDRSEHDLGALAREVQHIYRPLFVERRITLTVEAPAEPVVALLDRDRIVQVLSNLLGNAMKFVPENGAVQMVVARRDDDAELVVRDTGVGIPANALPHVFDRFWQNGQSGRRGLGLGLFICQQIIKAHGGRMGVESELGRGATFSFTLPTPPPPSIGP